MLLLFPLLVQAQPGGSQQKEFSIPPESQDYFLGRWKVINYVYEENGDSTLTHYTSNSNCYTPTNGVDSLSDKIDIHVSELDSTGLFLWWMCEKGALEMRYFTADSIHFETGPYVSKNPHFTGYKIKFISADEFIVYHWINNWKMKGSSRFIRRRTRK